MGRMLETMKLGEGRRAPLAIAKPGDETPAPAQDCVVEWEIGAEVPYVEVGGPNKKVELSPGLMKHPPQAVPQPPHLPIEAAPVLTKPKAVDLMPTRPMTAAFEPWPAPAPTPLGISTEIIAFHQPDHPASKEYAALLATILRSLKPDTANVLLLLGLKPHVGASTVLLNLAVSAALQKVRVIVVDANASRASLAQRLDHRTARGLVEVMAGTLALEQAVVKTGIGALHLLPAGASAKSPLTSESMSWLTVWLRERYDLIFIDGPTMEEVGDVGVQVPHADGIYLVLPQGETPSKGIGHTVSRLGGHLCGLIHTHFEM